MELIVLPGSYSIHQFEPDRKLPEIKGGFFSVTYTVDEISVVCREEVELESDSRNRDKHIRYIHLRY